jgi:hypothetical protein
MKWRDENCEDHKNFLCEKQREQSSIVGWYIFKNKKMYQISYLSIIVVANSLPLPGNWYVLVSLSYYVFLYLKVFIPKSILPLPIIAYVWQICWLFVVPAFNQIQYIISIYIHYNEWLTEWAINIRNVRTCLPSKKWQIKHWNVFVLPIKSSNAEVSRLCGWYFCNEEPTYLYNVQSATKSLKWCNQKIVFLRKTLHFI